MDPTPARKPLFLPLSSNGREATLHEAHRGDDACSPCCCKIFSLPVGCMCDHGDCGSAHQGSLYPYK